MHTKLLTRLSPLVPVIIFFIIFIHILFINVTPSGSDQLKQIFLAKQNAEQSHNAPANFAFIFTDRKELEAGESTILYVILAKGYNFGETSNVTVSTSLNYSPLIVNVANSPYERRFKIECIKSGVYQIFIRLENIIELGEEANLDGTNMLTLKVVDKSPYYLGTTGGLIIGAIIGLITSFTTTFFNEMRQRKQRRAEQINWIFNTLRPRIEATKMDISQRKDVAFSDTMVEFYKLGCYSILKEIPLLNAPGTNLGTELIKIDSLIDEYKSQLNKRKVEIPQSLIQNINDKMILFLENLERQKSKI